MDIRIGVLHSPRELEIELPVHADREETRKAIDDALASDDKVLWLTDRHGKDFGIPSARIAYIEFARAESERRVGFGAA